MINEIISNARIGAARAGLEAARNVGLFCGGWCPKGCNAEDRKVSDEYLLQETDSADYSEHIEMNVKHSDGTIIFTVGESTDSAALIIEFAKKHQKPILPIDLSRSVLKSLSDEISSWIGRNNIQILNVAGSKESENSGIYRTVYDILIVVFCKLS